MNNNNEFWITNISKRDITLHDLGITIRARTSINLLNKRHYNLTPEQLEKSEKEGSLFQKNKFIIKRINPPTLNSLTFKVAVDHDAIDFFNATKNPNLVDHNAVIPSRARSVYEIKQENYEELIVSDEQFAEDYADTVEMDKQPPIKGK